MNPQFIDSLLFIKQRQSQISGKPVSCYLIQLQCVFQYLISCTKEGMQSGCLHQNSSKEVRQRQGLNNRRTRSYQKHIASQKNDKQVSAQDQKEQVQVINRQRKNLKNRRNHSVKGPKCNSVIEYKIMKKGSTANQESDRKTQLNKEHSKIKKKEIEDELEHQEMIRQGITNSFNEQKSKIGTQRRQIIAHDILHPPIMNLSLKPERKSIKISQTESQRLEDHEYDQIVNEIHLNNLESKIDNNYPAAIKKQENQLAKIQSSESQVMASPQNNQKILDFINQKEEGKAQTSKFKPNMLKSKNEGNTSVLIMDLTEEKAIDQSAQKTLKQKHQQKQKQSNNQPDSTKINIKPCESEMSSQKQTQKKSSKVQQSKIFIATKIQSSLAEPPKSNKKQIKQTRKLTIVNAIVEEKVYSPKKIPVEEQEKKRLTQQINSLKSAVRQLKLQKIKARAEINMTLDSNFFQSRQEKKNSRYQTFNMSIEQKEDESEHYLFGRIRKNRSSSKKNVSYSLQSRQLTIQKESDLPQPFIINGNKFSQLYMTERKILASQQASKEYKTMNLQRISEENLEQSMKPPGNLDFSHELPVFRSQLRSNRINMRGPQICADVLTKFESSDKKFKRFVNRSNNRNRVQTNSIKIKTTQHAITSKNSEFSKEQSQQFESQQNQQLQGIILKNTLPQSKVEPYDKYELSRTQIQAARIIKEGQKIILSKRNQKPEPFEVPKIPEHPVYSTSNQEIMSLITQILPYSEIQYAQKDLEDCILKKYKNCIMFELKRFPKMKIIWYFNGKLYIGEWNINNNQKCGFGKQYIKDKYYYQGSFDKNKRHGYGRMTDKSSNYEGEWANGEKHGKGKYFNSEQYVYYQGEWKQGKRHGHGHYEYQGNIFEGNFQSGVKQGFGVELFKNGDRYIGNYSNDRFQGQGKYIWFNRSYYLGAFHQGFREGLGRWQSGPQNYELYIGQFVKDKKRGNGKYIWSNKCVYQGSFFNDLKHGMGSILYPDGRYVQGVWTQDILTDILKKVTEANRQQPLDEPKSRALQSHNKNR